MTDRNEYQRELMAKRRAKAREIIAEHLTSTPCQDCGNYYPRPAMTLGKVEDDGLPYKAILVNFGEERLRQELEDKLSVLCQNCSAIREASLE